MARFTEILKELGFTGDPRNFSGEQWKQIEEEMKRQQSEAYNRGERVGIRGNLTPEQQAEEDKRDLRLEDPTRGGSERKG